MKTYQIGLTLTIGETKVMCIFLFQNNFSKIYFNLSLTLQIYDLNISVSFGMYLFKILKIPLVINRKCPQAGK